MLEWELKLNARAFIDAANQGTAALTKLEQQIKKLEGVGSTGAVFKGNLAADLVGKLAGGVKDALGAIKQAGDEVVRSINERAAALRAYTTLLGSATEAEKEFGKAQALAARTDLTSAQVEGAQKSLMVAGFRGKELDAALLATTDVASMAAPGERELTTERFSRALSQIFSKGKLQGEEIRQLTEAGLSRSRLNQELIKMGVAKDAPGVEKAISGGNVSAQMGIAAIERAVLAQFGTKKLGEYATGASGTISGLESNIGEAWQNLAKGFNTEAVPAAERYRESLQKQSDAMQLSSQSGQNMSLVIQHFAETVMGLRSLWSDFATAFVTQFSESYTKVLRESGVMQDGWSKSSDIIKDLGTLLGHLGTVAAWTVKGIESIGWALETVRDAFSTAFRFIYEGALAVSLLLMGDMKGAKEHAANMMLGATARESEAEKDMARIRKEAAAFEGPAAGTEQGGGAAPYEPWAAKPLSLQTSKRGGNKGKGGGGGGGGGGDGGGGGGGGGGDGDTSIRVERVEINVLGTGDPDQVAQLVYDRFLADLRRQHHAGR